MKLFGILPDDFSISWLGQSTDRKKNVRINVKSYINKVLSQSRRARARELIKIMTFCLLSMVTGLTPSAWRCFLPTARREPLKKTPSNGFPTIWVKSILLTAAPNAVTSHRWAAGHSLKPKRVCTPWPLHFLCPLRGPISSWFTLFLPRSLFKCHQSEKPTLHPHIPLSLPPPFIVFCS